MKNTKLTSVKILSELYDSFKLKTVNTDMSLQKLANRSMDLYLNDGKFFETLNSYDNEKDALKRLQMIMDVVWEISKYDKKDLLHMYEDMKETLQHNISVLENYDIKTNLYDRIF